MSEEKAQDEALQKVLAMWQDKERAKEIKSIYAPKLSEGEFKTFVEIGISCGLNPFLREIWAVKYDEKQAAQIFIGRDGYRKCISRNPNFDGIIVDAVYQNDEFSSDLVKGEIRHVPAMKDRGKLRGAYCIIYMKNIKIPFYVFVELEEYNSGKSVWAQKPATMIKKVAECQCIRMADQACAGTYSDDEMPEDKTKDYKSARETTKNQVYEGESVNVQTGEIIKSIEKEVKADARQISEIQTLLTVAEVEVNAFKEWLNKKYKTSELESLSMQEAAEVTKRLREKAEATEQKRNEASE